eukprot:COSAG04_NODE_582_length_12404_cov_81.591792_3_plen_102_part_00
MNTWQPWGGAVRQDPLVILDPRTIAPSDCIEYLYGGGVGTGPMTICPNPDHNWCEYLPLPLTQSLSASACVGRPIPDTLPISRDIMSHSGHCIAGAVLWRD